MSQWRKNAARSVIVHQRARLTSNAGLIDAHRPPRSARLIVDKGGEDDRRLRIVKIAPRPSPVE
jgi:hypothetical protein